jgi:hypothetical protein
LAEARSKRSSSIKVCTSSVDIGIPPIESRGSSSSIE